MTARSSQFIKKRRAKMMGTDPHCHWCGVNVVYYQLRPGETTPDNFATIDHLYSRYSSIRQTISDGKTKTLVLACNECNQKRSDEETAALGIEEIRRRAGKPDKNWESYQARITERGG